MLLNRRLGAAAVAALLLTACSPTEQEHPTTPSPPSPVTHPPVAVPQDRDPLAVLAALRQLDPCALVDPARAKVAGYPADLVPVPYGPHRCLVQRTYGDDAVEVVLGSPFRAADRLEAAVAPVASVKAYRTGYADVCSVYLPVSFTLSIQVSARKGVRSTSNGDMCAPATAFATYAAARLTDPARAAAVLPMADRDACQVLTAALGTNLANYRVAINDRLTGIDSCGGDKEDPERAAPELSARLAFSTDPALEQQHVRVIADTRVRVYEDPSYCALAWSAGKLQTPQGGRTDQQVEVRAPDCHMGEAMATAAIAHLGQSPPPAPAPAPQQPITFTLDEPDAAAAGACALFTTLSDPEVCQPAQSVRVPSGHAAVLAAAIADPHTICSFTRDAITHHFGEQFTPVVAAAVTADRECVFVEATRAVEIHVQIRPDDRPQVERGARSVDIAGHTSAVHDNIEDPPGILYRITVAAARNTAENGTITFTAQFRLPRGTHPTDGTPIDTALGSKLLPAVTDVIRTYFAR